MATTKKQTTKSVTTAQKLGSVIKSARDIMRKDKGLNGEFDRHGVFEPYTKIPTNLLFFDSSQPIENIWYYEIPLPEDSK